MCVLRCEFWQHGLFKEINFSFNLITTPFLFKALIKALITVLLELVIGYILPSSS